jgi:hypothetical protein
MVQAAIAGMPSARTWCERNHVTLPEAVPDDEH